MNARNVISPRVWVLRVGGVRQPVRWRTLTVVILLTALLSIAGNPDSAAGGREPVTVTECGVVFPDPVDAYLVADLDCTTYPGLENRQPAITFLKRATLDLRGYTITAATGGAAVSTDVVLCWENCEVYGNGGTIVGGTFSVGGERRTTVVGATLRDMSHRAVDGDRKAIIENVTITGSQTEAIASPRRVIIRNSIITQNGGIAQEDTGLVRMTSAVVFAAVIRIFDSMIYDNAWPGAEAFRRVDAENSVITGNGTFPECGVTRTCNFDIGSRHKPRLRDSVCDVSLDMESCNCDGDFPFGPDTDPATHNWGVCASDSAP